MCGAHAVLFLNQSHFFNLKLAAGNGTHNSAELFAMWLLLQMAAAKGLKNLRVFRDSNLMVNWAKMQEVKRSFGEVSFFVFVENSIPLLIIYLKKLFLTQAGLISE